MEKTLIKYAENVIIEVAKIPSAQAVSDSDVNNLGTKRFQAALQSLHAFLRPLHETVIAACQNTSVTEAEVSLGMSFTAEGNLYFTKATAEATLAVKLKIDFTGGANAPAKK